MGTVASANAYVREAVAFAIRFSQHSQAAKPVTFVNYRVQPGDTISGITKKFGLKNISTLIAVNDIDNVRTLCSGQKLKIPSIDGLIYTVQKGNTLAGLSTRFGVTIEDLLDAIFSNFCLGK